MGAKPETTRAAHMALRGASAVAEICAVVAGTRLAEFVILPV